jgi:hypothetical protein
MRFLPAQRPASTWQRRCASVGILAALFLAGCDLSFASTGSQISNAGNPVVIVNQMQVVYLASNCNGPTATTVRAGANLVDLGPASSVCEQVAYPSEDGYRLTGYVPVYSIHRANNSVRCVYPNGCAIHVGPDATAPILSTLRPGDRVAGRGTAGTGAIITDGNHYSWWEVIDPATGQVGDVYGIFTVAF